jgi:hypothetical protein
MENAFCTLPPTDPIFRYQACGSVQRNRTYRFPAQVSFSYAHTDKTEFPRQCIIPFMLQSERIILIFFKNFYSVGISEVA